jgi:hypothetical protein
LTSESFSRLPLPLLTRCGRRVVGIACRRHRSIALSCACAANGTQKIETRRDETRRQQQQYYQSRKVLLYYTILYYYPLLIALHTCTRLAATSQPRTASCELRLASLPTRSYGCSTAPIAISLRGGLTLLHPCASRTPRYPPLFPSERCRGSVAL